MQIESAKDLKIYKLAYGSLWRSSTLQKASRQKRPSR